MGHLSGSSQPAETSGQAFADDRYFSDSGRYISGKGTCKSPRKKDTGYQEQYRSVLQQRQTGQAAQRTAGRKNSFAGAAAAAGARTALRQVEGGDEFYDACMTADILAAPVKNAADSGRDLYRRQAAQKAEKRIKKVRPGGTVRKKEAAAEKGNSKTGRTDETVTFKITEQALEISKTVPGIKIHKKVSVPGSSSTAPGMRKPVPGGSGTASVKKAGTGSRGWKNSQTASETGAGTFRTSVAGIGFFKAASAAEAGNFKTASAADTVPRTAEKLKINISKTAGMAENGNFKTVSAAEMISEIADTTDRQITRAADSSGTGIPCAPVSERKSVRTASGQQIFQALRPCRNQVY